MFLPKKLPQACGSVLVVLLLSGCAQLEQRWPWDGGRGERRAALLERASRETATKPDDGEPAPREPGARRSARAAEPEPAPPALGAAGSLAPLAPPEPQLAAPPPGEAGGADEPAQPAGPVEPIEPAAVARLELRGRVLSKTTGKPLATATPMVVFALPDPSDGSGEAHASALPPVTIARAAGVADQGPSLYVTSPGRGVRFENRDELCHEFFSSSGPNAFQLGMLEPGEARTVDLRTPGLVQVYCSLHAGRQLRVLVAPSEHHALVQPDGSFALPELAPGRYRVEAWGEGLRPRTLSVNVSATERRPLLIYVDPVPVTGAE